MILMFEHRESTCILSHRDCDCNLYSSLFAHSYFGWMGHAAFMGEQEMQVKFWLQSLKLKTFQLMHNFLWIVCNIITVDKYSESQWLWDVLEWEVHCNDCLTVLYSKYIGYYWVHVWNIKQFLHRPITSPEGSRRLRLPDFETVGTWRW